MMRPAVVLGLIATAVLALGVVDWDDHGGQPGQPLPRPIHSTLEKVDRGVATQVPRERPAAVRRKRWTSPDPIQLMREAASVIELNDRAMGVVRSGLGKDAETTKALLWFVQDALHAVKEAPDDMRRLGEALKDMDALAMGAAWGVFLVKNEARMQRTIDVLYEQAALHPDWFDGLDEGTLVWAFGGLDAAYVARRDDKGRARIRQYAEQILRHDPAELPEGLRERLSDLRDFAEALELSHGS